MEDGAGRRVGILVEGDVLTAVVAFVNEGGHLGAEAGHRAVVVGDVDGRAGPSANLQRFTERIEEAVAQGVARVGAVETSLLGGHGGDCRQFGSVAVRAGCIRQPGGEPERAVLHALSGEVAHGV